MTCTCSPSNLLSASNPKLWAVKAYLDLISKSDRLVPGSGTRRIYAMSHGLSTLNETDIIDMTNKSMALGIIPRDLSGFMNKAILRNCYIYGTILSDIINDRIVDIANGTVENPAGEVRNNSERARRYYYVPSPVFLARLQRAIKTDSGSPYRDVHLPAVSIESAAQEAMMMMVQYVRTEGTITDQHAAWGTLVSVVEKLVFILRNEDIYAVPGSDYRTKSRHALRILWVIAKFLTGDLSEHPSQGDQAAVDLEKRYNMSDGTLAAIPFPIKSSMSLFEDYDAPSGVTMKGRAYLAAAAAAAFHRCRTNDEG